MLSRREFISFQIKPEKDPDCRDTVSTSAIASDFSDEMLYREMMRMGKDPSNMGREQMLQTVLGQMRI